MADVLHHLNVKGRSTTCVAKVTRCSQEPIKELVIMKGNSRIRMVCEVRKVFGSHVCRAQGRSMKKIHACRLGPLSVSLFDVSARS